MKKLCILMSAYNGEKYIRCQLNSILAQICEAKIDIVVRDDNSQDATRTILTEYSKNNKNIQFYSGENLGTCNSFFDLLRKVDENYDYFAFADQDDFWLREKMSKAISAIEHQELIYNNVPCLYSSKVTPVNEELELINIKSKADDLHVAFGNAVIENICTGCTCVMNQNLFKIIKSKLPKSVYMHDWWFYLTASCFGKVIYDMDSYILYRQHSNNAIGIQKTLLGLMIHRMKNFNRNKNNIREQLTEFNCKYLLEGENQEIVSQILFSKKNIKNRLKIMFNHKIFRQKKIDTIIYKILFLFGF